MTNQINNPSIIPSTDAIQLTLTLKMTTAEVVETSVTVNNNSPVQDYVHPDDQTQPTFEFALFQTSSILFSFISFVKCCRNFLELNPKGPYQSLEKEKEFFFFTYSLKWTREIRKFHVAVVQRRLRNVQKSVMHVQICCFANRNLFFFAVFLAIAVAVVVAKALHCCDPEILLPW